MKNKIKVYAVMFVVGIFLSSYLIVFATGKIIKSLSFQNDDTHSQSDTTIIDSKSSFDESKNSNNNSAMESQQEIPSESSCDDRNKHSETTSEKEITSKASLPDSLESDNHSQEKSSSILFPSLSEDDSSDNQDASYMVSELVSDDNVNHDDKLISSLSSAGFSADDLEQLNCQQIITVNSNGNTAEIRFYYLNENGDLVYD